MDDDDLSDYPPIPEIPVDTEVAKRIIHDMESLVEAISEASDSEDPSKETLPPIRDKMEELAREFRWVYSEGLLKSVQRMPPFRRSKAPNPDTP